MVLADGRTFQEAFGPRGVIHSFADGRIEDTGPLSRKRMETVDGEFLEAALDFIDQAHGASQPFFVWFNSTRMHVWTHLKAESQGVTGHGIFADGMVEHDGHVGQLLDKLDQLGIADNTIVIYSTDNGAEVFSWPDGGTTMFRGEKNDNWEGGYRVPMLARWPGVIEPGTVSNDLISQLDWMPTLLAAVGDPDVKEKLRNGHQAGDKTFKVHLDGYNFLPYWRGQTDESPRREFFYFSDTTVGRSYSPSSGSTVLTCGRSPSCFSDFPRSSISGPTRLSVPTKKASATHAGASIACSFWSRRRRSWQTSWGPSGSFPRARPRRVSRSTKCWRR